MTEEDLTKIENLARIMIADKETKTKKFASMNGTKLEMDLIKATDYYYPETKVARAMVYLREIQRKNERG